MAQPRSPRAPAQSADAATVGYAHAFLIGTFVLLLAGALAALVIPHAPTGHPRTGTDHTPALL